MPVISIEIGHLTKGQKAELIRGVTNLASEVTKVPKEFFTVTLKELPDENIGIGGQTIDVIKEEYAKKGRCSLTNRLQPEVQN